MAEMYLLELSSLSAIWNIKALLAYLFCSKCFLTLNDLLYLYCVIPTSIDDQANHIKRKSNLIFGEAATTGLLKRKDERDISSDLRSEKQKADRQKPGHVIKKH